LFEFGNVLKKITVLCGKLMKRRCVVSILRHGDRCPSLNFYAPKQLPTSCRDVKAENLNVSELLEPNSFAAEEYRRWLSRAASSTTLKEFIQYFPVKFHDEGENNMHELPPELNPFSKITNLGLEQVRSRGYAFDERLEDMRGDVEVDVIATKYSRTQHSAQSFLNGYFDKRKDARRVEIEIPRVSENVANSWDAKQELRKAIQRSPKEDPEFHQRIESDHASSKKALISNLPYYRNPSNRFYWIYACDYFVCNESHGYEILDSLVEHRDPTLDCTLRRFLRWYQDEGIVRLAAGSMLRAVKQHMEKAKSSGKQAVALYFGHDITLLPLVAALGGHIRGDETPKFSNHWPSYASVLSFELCESSNGDHFVSAYFQDQEMETVLVQPEHEDQFWNERLNRILEA